MGSSFGDLFRVSTFGESHGGSVGVIVEGCPPRLEIDLEKIQEELDRRRPGQSKITTPRKELDQVEILSGIANRETLGTPIAMIVRNRDQRPSDYKEMKNIFRPSHADGTYHLKYGIQAPSGGGRASARETIGRVAAGAIAKQLLQKVQNTQILAWVKRIHNIEAEIDINTIGFADIESNIVRCPNQDVAKLMIQRIEEISRDGDSCGGLIECVVRNVPAGLGMPVFDKLEADLSKALMSLPATKGFEVGSGFRGTFLKGSEHNDAFIAGDKNRLRTATNNSGGIQGGISNGEPIILRVGFKPTATIRKDQQTIDSEGKQITLASKGRHDPCVLPRAVPMVEAMVSIVLADHLLRQRGQCSLW
ncbi:MULTISPECIES: chorismate synthase [Prochlorococcus]|uniref:Chorismate synthase n=1 Tax=Prochlorococcus marinus (strain SARG / CCMP1375 / SS120) TaxID=167539 RepID=AROC_PROMA|nr:MULTISPECIES: chorismate synthase [Prochlorococcus]P46894.2 RecName: Full=Chorismate synthase; Short=CS; AltName: Full=5-enolpyruvylshikimate-3-phosphate phospholyase [Prochlorococcus marinus subsp. marinus str. CCMP1375]AAP99299.1 Chorismate synthase [Prochlorococcus marinus subsp. marinus str. CCMP1375]KGG11429.1 Chorismate synthase [Prochlorococcus marinus str. LG]KGG18615.1 Chorismate synthase [Prochlorococcus marinus str. SS2]KGG22888.1 Chorismate synthase [Prochlorococcus marinus str.